MYDLARTPKQIGTHIRRNRKRLGLSQRELGDRAGLRQETISLIENGNAATRMDTMLAVLAALESRRNHDSSLVREHVNWALARLQTTTRVALAPSGEASPPPIVSS